MCPDLINKKVVDVRFDFMLYGTNPIDYKILLCLL